MKSFALVLLLSLFCDMGTITMKALSLKQPWANLILSGQKTIETRKWQTSYRGDVLICTSKKPEIYPFGMAVGIANLYHIEKMTTVHEGAAMTKVYDRAYSWFLKGIAPVKPFPVKGKLLLFDIEVNWNELEFLK